jgi:hypothetical protein
MAFSDVLKSLVDSIKSGAPHLQEIENGVNEVTAVVAAVDPAIAPVVAGLKIAETVVNDVTGATAAAINAPAASTESLGTDIGDAASIAAKGVASAEQSTDTLVQRLMAVESAIVQIAPILASIAKEMGL